jgi:hypothetical protein
MYHANQLFATILRNNSTSDSACSPIGLLAARIAAPSVLTIRTAQSLVRVTDKVIDFNEGTHVFIPKTSSLESIHAVSARLKTVSEALDTKLTLEWALLNELSDRTASDTSEVISALGCQVISRISPKIH